MTQVAEKIAEEIRIRGPIPFARFMELALYCPVYGYYEREGDNIGPRGDYYTSVSAAPLFGQLLAFQFCDWLRAWEESPGGGREDQTPVLWPGSRCPEGGQERGNRGDSEAANLMLVEAGAHRGALAREILTWIEKFEPGLYAKVKYCIVEPSERRQTWQQERLAEFTGKVRWVSRLSDLSRAADAAISTRGMAGIRGIIFSNELLDAMPVRRLGWDSRSKVWFEWGVRLDGNRFGWTKLDVRVDNPVASLSEALPDEYTIDTCPAAVDWWRQAADVLVWGKLLTLDYGLTAEELFLPERTQGTLRAYRRHQPCADVLAEPGDQDLTAHVNFTELQQVGEAAELQTECLSTQEQFLTRIAGRWWGEANRFGDWNRERTRQFQALTHPEHLGRAFRALVQTRITAPVSGSRQ